MNPDPTTNPPTPRSPGEPGAWGSSRWEGRRCRDLRTFRHHHHHRLHGVVLGLTVIAWGALLLLREMGLVDPALHALDFWPLLLVGFGLSALLRWRNAGSVLFGLVVGALGTGLLAERLGWAGLPVVHLWPILVIAAGLALMLRGAIRTHPRPFSSEKLSAEVLERNVTMGNLKLAVDSQQFKGARLGATMGEVQVDLRRAAMSGDEAAIEVSLVMGGIELWVPGNWQVVSDVAPFMGAVEDKTEARPDSSGVQKRLVIRGSITMGAVTIRN